MTGSVGPLKPHIVTYRLGEAHPVRYEVPADRDPFAILESLWSHLGLSYRRNGAPLDGKPETGENLTSSTGAGKQTLGSSSLRSSGAPGPLPGTAPERLPSQASPRVQGGDAAARGEQKTATLVAATTIATPEPEGRVPNSTSVTPSGVATSAKAEDKTGTEAPAEAPRRGVRDTSRAAYRALTFSGTMAAQQRLVLEVFLKDPRVDWTRRELVDAVGIPVNAICGRVNELLAAPFELLVELPEKRKCKRTDNMVSALALAEIEEGKP